MFHGKQRQTLRNMALEGMARPGDLLLLLGQLEETEAALEDALEQLRLVGGGPPPAPLEQYRRDLREDAA